MFCSANTGHALSAKKPRCTTLSRLTKRGGGDGGKEVAQFILLFVKARKRTSLLMFKAVAELVTSSRADDDDGQSLFAQ